MLKNMTPLKYLLDESNDLGDIIKIPARVLVRTDAPAYAWVGLPVGNSIGFVARDDVASFAFYRIAGGTLEMVSPFGSYALPMTGLDARASIGLLAVSASGSIASWTVDVTSEWGDDSGAAAQEGSLKARVLGSGVFEPLHALRSSRGVDARPQQWVMVLLTEAPRSIRKKSGRAVLETAYGQFALPEGSASELALAGKIQWGLPDEEGFFVLQPRPSA